MKRAIKLILILSVLFGTKSCYRAGGSPIITQIACSNEKFIGKQIRDSSYFEVPEKYWGIISPNNKTAYIPINNREPEVLFQYLVNDKSITIHALYSFELKKWLNGNTISQEEKEKFEKRLKDEFLVCE